MSVKFVVNHGLTRHVKNCMENHAKLDLSLTDEVNLEISQDLRSRREGLLQSSVFNPQHKCRFLWMLKFSQLTAILPEKCLFTYQTEILKNGISGIFPLELYFML